jgi:DNA-binding NtrC family response regulator
MEHAHIIAGGGPILPQHLPRHLTSRPATLAPSSGAGRPSLSVAPGTSPAAPAATPARTLSEIEMEHVLRVLHKHNGSKTAAAAELGISLKTMYNKLNKIQEERKTAG